MSGDRPAVPVPAAVDPAVDPAVDAAVEPAIDPVDELERRLGDPYDPANPMSFTAILDADERAEMHAAGERVLDQAGLNAEFVPVADGGRLHRLDRLIDILRAVYRRDACLGLGYGFSSFIAGVNVWAAATGPARRTVADLLLSNERVASAYHELAHGNDMARVECRATPGRDQVVLRGRKEVVTNLERATALVLFARSDPRAGSRSHSQVLVDKRVVPAGRMRYLPRFPSVGMRGVQLGGVEFADCPVPRDSVLGVPGHGFETALKSFQLTRTLLPAVMAGQVDTGLRATLRHVLGRRLYGRPAADLPQLRSILVGVFVDLLTVDCLTGVVARAIHVAPATTSVAAPTAKHLASRVLLDAMTELSTVLGAHFYLRRGETGIFQKMQRDLLPVAFGHVGRAACETAVLPQLPQLARRSWRTPETAPAALFDRTADLPALAFDRLSVTAAGRDPICAGLAADWRSTDAGGEGGEPLSAAVRAFLVELDRLAGECAALRPGDTTITATPAAARLVGRYGLVLAASAAAQTWLHTGRDRHRGEPDPFLADPVWVLAVLTRLRARMRGRPGPLPGALAGPLFDELLRRYETGRSFDLSNRRLAGGPEHAG